MQDLSFVLHNVRVNNGKTKPQTLSPKFFVSETKVWRLMNACVCVVHQLWAQRSEASVFLEGRLADEQQWIHHAPGSRE